MIDISHSVDGTIETPTAPLASDKQPARSRLWQRLGLIGVMLVLLFMNFYQLGQNGFGNAFYAAGVRSMLDSWHNFFFVSYDPGGFVTLDKPPLGFWLQTISAKLFGFTAFSVYLPQALAGVLSVWVLYHLVKRHFGVVAGLLASLALAISPISVVTNRNNTIDSTLTLVLLLGAWAVMKAAETGKLRWLLLCAVAIGLGFNIKALEAYLVLPAFGLLYLLAAPKKIWTRILHLAMTFLLLLTISLSWAVAVDLTPASQRPYVGSSQNNSEISLALGYNGISRLIGGSGLPGSNSSQPKTSSSTSNSSTQTSSTSTASSTSSSSSTTAQPSSAPPTGEGGTGGAGGFNIGTAGPLRLFSEGLGGQIAWLLPFAMLSILAVAWQKKPHVREDKQQQSLIVWGTWLITMGVFFSVASFFHQYYLTIMAPAICALFGIGAVVMWRNYRSSGWRGWLLPVAIVATAATQIYLLSSYPTWSQWLTPIIAGLSGLAVLALVIVRLVKHNTKYGRLVKSAFCAGMLVLLLAPAAWSTVSVIQNNQSSLPVAGPTQTMSFGGGQDNNSSDAKLVSYLESNQGSAKYLVATVSSQEADQIILDTNKPVMTLGGFSGSDPILTTSQLAALAQSGQVRYFLISSGGMGGSSQQSALISWIKSHSTVVSTSQWQSSSTSSTSHGFGGEEVLYEYTVTK
jgi:4-amino-4-deoxy-L-arabinose transferase-like glycosyltransferase